eukprot:CAMPEP_0194267424 /NCGR_PEP_ID=MMETSP0169-20130528/1927_1 /TAXON_ID=218684 /ORGANISM="Corethron pennatum, Strain L29A3" /LENGTH=276 /DNA_ID=CAMNT_0039008253 /DNA_START=88 /DNA_END=915 /DNA_ORIENTATION=+
MVLLRNTLVATFAVVAVSTVSASGPGLGSIGGDLIHQENDPSHHDDQSHIERVWQNHLAREATKSHVCSDGEDQPDENCVRTLQGGKSGKSSKTYAPTGSAEPTTLVKAKSAKSKSSKTYAPTGSAEPTMFVKAKSAKSKSSKTYAPTSSAEPTLLVHAKSAKSELIVETKSKGKGKGKGTYSGTDAPTISLMPTLLFSKAKSTGKSGKSVSNTKNSKTYAPTVSAPPTLLKSKAKSAKSSNSEKKAAKSADKGNKSEGKAAKSEGKAAKSEEKAA